MINDDCNCLIEKIKKGSYERGVPTTKGGSYPIRGLLRTYTKSSPEETFMSPEINLKKNLKTINNKERIIMGKNLCEKIMSIFKSTKSNTNENDNTCAETKVTKPRLVSMDMAAYYKDKTLRSIFPNQDLTDVTIKDYNLRSDIVLSKPVDVVIVTIEDAYKNRYKCTSDQLPGFELVIDKDHENLIQYITSEVKHFYHKNKDKCTFVLSMEELLTQKQETMYLFVELGDYKQLPY